VFKTPRGNPTGFGGPGIEGSDTAWAARVGGTLTRDFGGGFSGGFKAGYQWTGNTSFATTLPGERIGFGREGEFIFAAVATYSFSVGH
jgi:hypothetical protein